MAGLTHFLALTYPHSDERSHTQRALAFRGQWIDLGNPMDPTAMPPPQILADILTSVVQPASLRLRVAASMSCLSPDEPWTLPTAFAALVTTANNLDLTVTDTPACLCTGEETTPQENLHL